MLLLGPGALLYFPISLFSEPDVCGHGLLLSCHEWPHRAGESQSQRQKYPLAKHILPIFVTSSLESSSPPGCNFSTVTHPTNIHRGPTVCQEPPWVLGHGGEQALPRLLLRTPVQYLMWTSLSHESPTLGFPSNHNSTRYLTHFFKNLCQAHFLVKGISS